jgi:hypothetical protein
VSTVPTDPAEPEPTVTVPDAGAEEGVDDPDGDEVDGVVVVELESADFAGLDEQAAAVRATAASRSPIAKRLVPKERPGTARCVVSFDVSFDMSMHAFTRDEWHMFKERNEGMKT